MPASCTSAATRSRTAAGRSSRMLSQARIGMLRASAKHGPVPFDGNSGACAHHGQARRMDAHRGPCRSASGRMPSAGICRDCCGRCQHGCSRSPALLPAWRAAARQASAKGERRRVLAPAQARLCILDCWSMATPPRFVRQPRQSRLRQPAAPRISINPTRKQVRTNHPPERCPSLGLPGHPWTCFDDGHEPRHLHGGLRPCTRPAARLVRALTKKGVLAVERPPLRPSWQDAAGPVAACAGAAGADSCKAAATSVRPDLAAPVRGPLHGVDGRTG